MALARRAGAGKKTMGAYGLVAELSSGYLGPAWIAHSSRAPFAGMPLMARRIAKGRSADDEGLDQLQRAADWAVSLEHDHLAGVLGSERDEEELVVISAYHEGESLRSLLRLAGIGRKPLPAEVVQRIAHDVLSAAAYLHRHGEGEQLASAALNPDNVIVCSDGHTRVLEPGVSAAAARIGSWAEDPKRAAYDPPEKLAGGEVGPEGDVFTVGVLMWELVRNRPLFAAANVASIQTRMAGPVRRVDALTPTGGAPIAAGVADVIARALDSDPDERFVSPAEMLAAVEAEDPASHEQVALWIADFASAALAKQRRKVNEVVSLPPPAPALAPAPHSPPGPRAKKISSAPSAALVVSSRPPRGLDMPTIPAAPAAKKQPQAGGVDKSTRLGMMRLPQPSDLVELPFEDGPAPFETRDPAIPPPPVGGPAAASSAFLDEPTHREGARSSDVFGAEALMAAAATPPPEPQATAPAAQQVAAPPAPADPDDSGGLFSIADDPSMDEELPPEALRALERARSADKRPLLVPLLVGGALLVVIVILIALLLTGDRQADPSGTIYPSVGPAGATPSPRIARTALTSISTPPGGI